MKEQERFRAAFGPLHASADTLTEVKKQMNQKNSSRGPRHMTKRVFTLALAAALLLILGVSAYAAGVFGMRVEEASDEDLAAGLYYPQDAEGGTDPEAGPQTPEEGLTFTFTADTPVYQVEFRPGWLPATPNHVWDGSVKVPWREGNWYRYLYRDSGPTGSYGDLGIQYQISVAYARPDYRLTLFGEHRIVKTDTWGDLSVTEAEMLYTDFRGPENYVIRFS